MAFDNQFLYNKAVQILDLPPKRQSNAVKNFVIPALVLVGIIMVDHFLLPGVTIAPVCNFLAMGMFALYLHPRAMAFWACCFVVSSLIMLNWTHFSMHGPLNTSLTAETRSIGAVAGALVAILLCANRNKASRSHEQLVTLVKHLPVPFLLSDKNGMLLYVSEEAAKLMNITQQVALGETYFALLFNPLEKGAAIQKYLRLLDSHDDHEITTELKLRNCPDKTFAGTLLPVDLQMGRCLITVIHEPLEA